MLTEHRDGLTAVLTLDYPERRNALAIPMRRALVEALERIEADPALRAIVITGAGGTFCAGGDISGMDVADLAAGRERFRLTHQLVRLLVKGSKPIVAAVEGWCVGAGLSLAMCCDTVMAAQDARFAAGFGKIGLIADLGLLHTLPARIGQGRARQVFLYGDPMNANRAEQIGLVDELVEPGNALDAATARARRLAEAAPLPVALTRQWLAAGLDAALDWEREAQSSLFLTADHAEGKAAF
ncbi:MAG TPA: enoyl-CoA hydratase/isomerase family protein, partial [Acetobacteraceae bacterium]